MPARAIGGGRGRGRRRLAARRTGTDGSTRGQSPLGWHMAGAAAFPASFGAMRVHVRTKCLVNGALARGRQHGPGRLVAAGAGAATPCSAHRRTQSMCTAWRPKQLLCTTERALTSRIKETSRVEASKPRLRGHVIVILKRLTVGEVPAVRVTDGEVFFLLIGRRLPNSTGSSATIQKSGGGASPRVNCSRARVC